MRTARGLAAAACLSVLACRLEQAPSGRLPGPPTVADSLARVEQDSSLTADVQAVLRAFFDRASARDWRAIRGAFWPGATVAAPWTPPGERAERRAIQSVDEYVRRTAEGPGRMNVYGERMLHSHVTGYGDVADAWVLYEVRAGRSRDSVKVTRGVNAFHLVRDGSGWRIVSLAVTAELASRPLMIPPRGIVRRADPPVPAPDRAARKSSP